MKTIRHNTLLRTLALGVLASCLGAVVASAQPVRGTFSLPTAVRWGAATLQAGNYTISSEGVKTGNMLQVVQGGKVVALVMPQSHNPAVAGPAALVIDKGKGGRTVRELRLPDIGVVLYYAPVKPKHGTAAEEREVAELIPIAPANATW
ncbi:MAG: hypothetical protein ACLP6W_06525 [Bryobacteraceae bacterium]